MSRTQLETAEMYYRQRSEEMRSARSLRKSPISSCSRRSPPLVRSRPHADEEMPRPATDGRTSAQKVASQTDSDPVNGNASGWNFPIYSPITGRVLRVFQESAAVVTPGTPLVELGDPRDLEVAVDVLSRDAVEIQPGDLAILEHWGGEKPLEGHVRVVEPSGFTKISTLGVEEQRVNVIIDLDAPPEKRQNLGDGFRVEAKIVVDEVAQCADRAHQRAIPRWQRLGRVPSCGWRRRTSAM